MYAKSIERFSLPVKLLNRAFVKGRGPSGFPLQRENLSSSEAWVARSVPRKKARLVDLAGHFLGPGPTPAKVEPLQLPGRAEGLFR